MPMKQNPLTNWVVLGVELVKTVECIAILQIVQDMCTVSTTHHCDCYWFITLPRVYSKVMYRTIIQFYTNSWIPHLSSVVHESSWEKVILQLRNLDNVLLVLWHGSKFLYTLTMPFKSTAHISLSH
jgi:hypothetical protein